MTERELAQRHQALTIANESRVARAAILGEIRAGARSAADLLILPPVEVAGVFVFDLLRAVPHVGLSRVHDWNREAIREDVNLAVAVGAMPPGRRQWLGVRLAAHERAFGRSLPGRLQG